MAHFAKVENNIVTQVIVINNEVITNNKGKEVEQLGIDFCKSLYGSDTEWVQTSYNGTFRGKYAGAGDIYDPVLNIFKSPTIEETVTE
jgi:hypothetical protein